MTKKKPDFGDWAVYGINSTLILAFLIVITISKNWLNLLLLIIMIVTLIGMGTFGAWIAFKIYYKVKK